MTFNPSRFSGRQSAGAANTLIPSGPVTPHDQVADLLARAGVRFDAPSDTAPNVFTCKVEDRTFRFVVPTQGKQLLMVADVFTGDESQVAQMGIALLHANYQSQQFIAMAPMPAANEPGGGDADAPPLPVMGLDLERMTVVMSMLMPLLSFEEANATETLKELLTVINRDAGIFVSQFQELTR